VIPVIVIARRALGIVEKSGDFDIFDP